MTSGWITAIKAARGYQVKRPCTRLRRHRRRPTPGPGRLALQRRRDRCPAGAPWGVCPTFSVSLAQAFANDDSRAASRHFINQGPCVSVQWQMIDIEKHFIMFPVFSLPSSFPYRLVTKNLILQSVPVFFFLVCEWVCNCACIKWTTRWKNKLHF